MQWWISIENLHGAAWHGCCCCQFCCIHHATHTSVLSIHFVDFPFQINHHKEHSMSPNVKVDVTSWQMRGTGVAPIHSQTGTRRRSAPHSSYFTPGKDLVHIVQEAGWSWRQSEQHGKSCLHQDSIPGQSSQ
jgi:hypothetical protein